MRFNEMIEGLQLLAKYEEKGLEAHLNGADHDVIYGATADVGDQLDEIDVDVYLEEHGDYPDTDDLRLNEEDNIRLRELGWYINPENEVWEHHC